MTKITILVLKKQLLFVVFATILSFPACNPDEISNIPLVQVNFQYNINLPQYINLQTIGGSVEVFGGSRGIILYRLSSDEIKAYDRHCTFEPSNTCGLVSADPNRFTATDNCCGSSFLLGTGDVSKPPAILPLKQYTVNFNDPILTVTN
ncbi:MAG: nitrite reductase/ring-hydroxylating ferredoxin subunit [Vicingaceae bacterium]|jgi:nitrite reductase/ring-hydroxylating ferredoxin subunit